MEKNHQPIQTDNQRHVELVLPADIMGVGSLKHLHLDIYIYI